MGQIITMQWTVTNLMETKQLQKKNQEKERREREANKQTDK